MNWDQNQTWKIEKKTQFLSGYGKITYSNRVDYWVDVKIPRGVLTEIDNNCDYWKKRQDPAVYEHNFPALVK